MTTEPNKWQASLPAWGAFALSVFTVLWYAAVTTGNIEENMRRVEQLEAEARTQRVDNRVVIERLARIEAKLDTITETKP